jgi:tetratricopeptide (TPR) repeat protein
MKRTILIALSAAAALYAADTKEEPVGLVLSAGSGKVLRANTETALAARAGDILFSGDDLRVADAPASFLFCPSKTSQTLTSGSEVILGENALKVKAGKLDPPKPVNACFLPQVVRVAVASQQHYGVSMTRGLSTSEGDVIPFDSLTPSVRGELQPLEDALKANPNDVQSLIEEAAILDRENLQANALAAYKKVAAQWTDAVWVRGRMFELQESLATQAALKAAAVSPDAKTYALMIGISKYQKLPKELWLQYAEADAKTFQQHLASVRGGGVPSDQVMVLSDDMATTAAIRNGFQTFLRNRAGKNDTVFVLIDAQGTVDSRGTYILSWDSDPEDLSATAIPISEIQSLLDTELGNVGRVVLLADISRNSNVGDLKSAGVGSAVEKLGEAKGEMLGLMATRPKEYSMEGTQFGGGHGAFTFSVLQGLQGAAAQNGQPYVTANGIISYVRDNVPKVTDNKQHPRDFGSMEGATRLSDLTKGGINISQFRKLQDPINGGPLLLAAASPQDALNGQAAQDVAAFQAAIAGARLLPTDQNSAWDLIDKLRAELPPQQMLLQENALRVALENQAQQVLLRYLAGDQSPQAKSDFDSGSRFMEAAIRLTPESLYLEGRDDFFRGRGLLFDKQYPQAADLLEKSVRIDPGEAYPYNALGIAYLEQADFAKAIPAFRDAARRAPNWAYPLHNLALAYVESGDYENAIRSYQQAIKLTPQYSYLPYNLGLVYQRLNRRTEAEASYRKAMALAPNSAEPLNALGSLKASEGKSAEAEKFYRDALKLNPNKLEARHNLAVLLEGEKGRQSEAVDAFRQNLATDPTYLPSRLSLAELLDRTGDTAGAIEQYLMVVNDKPDYVAARTHLASLYSKSNQPDKAVEQLRAAAKLDAQDASLWEQIGDAERAAGHQTEARDAFAAALKLQINKSDQKRIRTKMNF